MSDKNLPDWVKSTERWLGTFEWLLLRLALLLLLLLELIHLMMTRWRGIME
jgi:hypothetical protein